jgi:hypothetical protein
MRLASGVGREDSMRVIQPLADPFLNVNSVDYVTPFAGRGD